jgi:hypothetical protein
MFMGCHFLTCATLIEWRIVTYTRFLAAVMTVMAPIPLAQAQECSLNYSVFETTVPHIDMEECPQALKADGQFCRLAVSAEEAHVFVFREADGCLLSTRTWSADDFEVTLK